MFVSYAQNFEDIMLWRALGTQTPGFYIDIGALSPDFDSVTRAFYERGWRGLNVEPNPAFFAEFEKARPRDVNLQVAVSDVPGTAVMHFLSSPGLSTLDTTIAERHIASGLTSFTREVETITLAKLWREHVTEGQSVHFLKIDVEGMEASVLRSNDWERYRPWVIVVESTYPMSQIEVYAAWEPILQNAGYRFVYADGLNRYYLDAAHVELTNAFVYPPNVFDEFRLRREIDFEKELRAALTRLASVEESLRIRVDNEAIQICELNYLRERKGWEDLFFHKNGEPIWFLKWALLGEGGTPRRVVRWIVFGENGQPRRPFRRWMAGAASLHPAAELVHGSCRDKR
jgi:FkbM family methyltransferase